MDGNAKPYDRTLHNKRHVSYTEKGELQSQCLSNAQQWISWNSDWRHHVTWQHNLLRHATCATNSDHTVSKPLSILSSASIKSLKFELFGQHTHRQENIFSLAHSTKNTHISQNKKKQLQCCWSPPLTFCTNCGFTVISWSIDFSFSSSCIHFNIWKERGKKDTCSFSKIHAGFVYCNCKQSMQSTRTVNTDLSLHTSWSILWSIAGLLYFSGLSWKQTIPSFWLMLA